MQVSITVDVQKIAVLVVFIKNWRVTKMKDPILPLYLRTGK